MSARFVPAVLAAIVLALAIPSACADIAGQPKPGDITSVDSCLEKAKSAGNSAATCIGVVATPCENAATTLSDKEACYQREDAVWSLAIVRDYGRLVALLKDPGAREALTQAEMGYERAKLGLCTFERIARGNAPDALLASSKCRLDAAARQEMWLTREIEAVSHNATP